MGHIRLPPFSQFEGSDAGREGTRRCELPQERTGESSFTPQRLRSINACDHGQNAALDHADCPFCLPVLLMGVGSGLLLPNAMRIEVIRELVVEFASIVTSEDFHWEPVLYLPGLVSNLERSKSLISSRQKVKLEVVGAVIEENDEITLPVRGQYWEGASNVRVH
jgi:hypothetical protein